MPKTASYCSGCEDGTLWHDNSVWGFDRREPDTLCYYGGCIDSLRYDHFRGLELPYEELCELATYLNTKQWSVQLIQQVRNDYTFVPKPNEWRLLLRCERIEDWPAMCALLG